MGSDMTNKGEAKPTICLDFDGVVNWYRPETRPKEYNHAIINDVPVPGVWNAIRELRKKYRVVVYSVRCSESKGVIAISNWLWRHQIQVDDICSTKPPAMIYVDDRGVQFRGDWHKTLKDIEEFSTWLS